MNELVRQALVVVIAVGSAVGQTGCASLSPAAKSGDPIVTGRVTPPPMYAAPKTSVYGRSVEGTSLLAQRFEGGPEVVLLFAGIHGNEKTTVAVMADLLDAYAALPREPNAPTVVIVTLANPDGFASDTRVNSRGVDLNRNFPATNFKPSKITRYANGPSPLSEPESKALFDLVTSLKPTRILALHSIRPPKHGVNFDGPAEPLAQLIADQNHYNVLPTMGYDTPGSFGSWAGVDHHIPTITLELKSTASAETSWAENREALLTFIRGR